MWPSGLTLAMRFTLNFQGQIWNLLYLNQKKVRLPRNEKQTYRMNSTSQMWPMGSTLAISLIFEFSRSNVTYTFDHMHCVDHGFSFGDQGQVKGSTT